MFTVSEIRELESLARINDEPEPECITLHHVFYWVARAMLRSHEYAMSDKNNYNSLYNKALVDELNDLVECKVYCSMIIKEVERYDHYDTDPKTGGRFYNIQHCATANLRYVETVILNNSGKIDDSFITTQLILGTYNDA